MAARSYRRLKRAEHADLAQPFDRRPAVPPHDLVKLDNALRRMDPQRQPAFACRRGAVASRPMYFITRHVFNHWYRSSINLNFHQNRHVTVINAARWRLEGAGKWKNSGIPRWRRARGGREYSLRDSPSQRQSASPDIYVETYVTGYNTGGPITSVSAPPSKPIARSKLARRGLPHAFGDKSSRRAAAHPFAASSPSSGLI